MLIIDKYNKSMTISQGEDAYISYRRSDYADLSSVDFYFTVKPINSTTLTDSDALITMNPENMSYADYIDGETTYSDAIVTIKVADSETILPYGTYKYDLKEIDNGTEKIRLCGNYIVKCGITKRA